MHHKVLLFIIKYLHQLPPTEWLTLHRGIGFTHGCVFWYSRQVEWCLTAFLYHHSYLSSIWICSCAALSSQFPCGCCVAGLVFPPTTKMISLFICLLWPHYHDQLMSDRPMSLYVFCHFLFFVWPAPYYIH